MISNQGDSGCRNHPTWVHIARAHASGIAAKLRRRGAKLLPAAAVSALLALSALSWSGGAAVAAPPEPYSRLLPLELRAPATGAAGRALEGFTVRLQNPGAEAPNSRLRLIIHETNHGHDHARPALNPDNVKVEVLEGGAWTPVLLGVTDGGVIGAIGSEGVAQHQERHKRGGFPIREGAAKRWPLRVTFDVPGSYTLVVAVSPDNGSRHLAQPAHSSIEVR